MSLILLRIRERGERKRERERERDKTLSWSIIAYYANGNGMMVEFRSSVLEVAGSNLCASYCFGPERLLLVRCSGLRTWYEMFEARF